MAMLRSGNKGTTIAILKTREIKRNGINNGPVFGSRLELLNLTLFIFRPDVPNLDILKIEDILGMSSNSIMPFHNLDPKLFH